MLMNNEDKLFSSEKNSLARYSSIKRQKVSLIEEIYNKVEIPLLNCLSKSPFSNRGNKSARSNNLTPKLNSVAMQRLEHYTNTLLQANSSTKSKPHYITQRSSQKHKLYRSPVKFSKQREIPSSPLREKNLEFTTKPIKSPSPVKDEIILNDLKLAIQNIKSKGEECKTARSQNTFSPKKTSNLRESNKKDMCNAIKGIVKQCENIKNNIRSTEKIENNIVKEAKVVKQYTSAMKWTTDKLHEWADYEKPIMKELYDQDLFTKNLQKEHAEGISKDLSNRSCHEIRSQAKFIKKVLIKNKLKLL
ncbi:hypothetical protein SteCoe_24301 [Stentor coeruleus]|uniref:Uncharacterized protein n=1 Tax=Stentor coeruleus TaxID=5963 RepID=A0A1R2BHZ3_9CILI|nr:hypothetical protein SteCoe_24301 [Stentor coeruleus]